MSPSTTPAATKAPAPTKAPATTKPKAETDKKREEKKQAEATMTSKIFDLLKTNKKPMLATEIGAAVGIKDAAAVRRLVRSAGKKAESEGFTFVREITEGNKKAYNIAKK